ncbi:MAG: hypothetical protein IJQ15_03545 [Synergistaceae bacterium]|nr:hypothetical protein [Synergistaceae bacterium]
MKKIAVCVLVVLMFSACVPPSADAFSWSDLNPATWGRKTVIAVTVGTVGTFWALGRGAVKAYAAEDGKGAKEFWDGCKEGAGEAWDIIKIFW